MPANLDEIEITVKFDALGAEDEIIVAGKLTDPDREGEVCFCVFTVSRAVIDSWPAADDAARADALRAWVEAAADARHYDWTGGAEVRPVTPAPAKYAGASAARMMFGESGGAVDAAPALMIAETIRDKGQTPADGESIAMKSLRSFARGES